MKIKLAKTELIHFIGIGGIGMSGLALIMKGKGFRVQGSDISINKNIERLKKEKIKVLIGHKKQNINKATILVVSSAIKKNNPEMLEAIKKQLPIYKRGEMLANIVSLTKNIVVVGSHGKTTTTSLIASIFQETKIDPTIINGGVWIINQKNFDKQFFEDLLIKIIKNKQEYIVKKNNLENLNFQNTWNNVNQNLLSILNEN